MPWLKVLHISALIIWCAVLLYLPAAVAVAKARADNAVFSMPHHRARWLFTLVATPAALLAIISGTALFMVDTTLGVWLIAKLTAVAGMVLCHALYGLLIIRSENGLDKGVSATCAVLGVASMLLILAALWLVLQKPSFTWI